jgi:hypothetical protein
VNPKENATVMPLKKILAGLFLGDNEKTPSRHSPIRESLSQTNKNKITPKKKKEWPSIRVTSNRPVYLLR